MAALQHFTLNFSDAYCPHGYCCMAFDVALLLLPTNKFQDWYQKIVVVGVKDEKKCLEMLAAANRGCNALRIMEHKVLSGEIRGQSH